MINKIASALKTKYFNTSVKTPKDQNTSDGKKSKKVDDFSFLQGRVKVQVNSGKNISISTPPTSEDKIEIGGQNIIWLHSFQSFLSKFTTHYNNYNNK